MDLNFNTGMRRLNINGDKDKYIEFNPLDISVYAKFMELHALIDGFDKKMEELVKSEDELAVSKFILSKDKDIREKIDSIFGAGSSDKIFGNVNVFTPTTDGTFVFENFLNALRPIIEADAKKLEENTKQKTSKYTGKYEVKEDNSNNANV